MADYILEMKNIDKSFFKVKVLDQVNFAVRPGEVHALVGENGAGKSTLVKILMGIYERDSGNVLIDDKEVLFHNPREAIDHGVSMIHQELNPVLDMEVAENVFLGREIPSLRLGPLSLVNKKEQRKQTVKLFTKMGLTINPKILMRNLSVAQKQLVEIVKAISLSSRIVIMDEPTSAITDKEVATLFEQIAKLKAENVAIIYISHKMDEIFRIADMITVLRDGQHIHTGAAKDLDKEQIIKMMVGREITEFYPKQDIVPGANMLEVKNLSCGDRFQNVGFSLKSGEILGVAGLVGAGRSEMVETIFGIRHSSTGEIWLNGSRVNIRHPKHAIQKKIALITEDRKETGLNLMGTVEHNISIVGLKMLSPFGMINSRREAKAADLQIDKMKIKVISRRSMISSLSGGNQQKVVLSKWLLTEPDIIILDEPTRGIDVGAKRDIYVFMGELAKAGKAILMISSEIPELIGLSDRILVLAAGKLTGILDRSDFSQENIIRLASKFEAIQHE